MQVTALHTLVIEQDIATRLAVLNAKPTVAETNAVMPLTLYTVSLAEAPLTLDGASDLMRFTVDVEVHTQRMADTLAMLNVVRGLLHYWREGRIKGSFLTAQSTQEEEDRAVGMQTYNVWAKVTSNTYRIKASGGARPGGSAGTS